MKQVIVVGSVARNSNITVHHVVYDLSKRYDRIYISKSFEFPLPPKGVVWVPGRGNIERRLKEGTWWLDEYHHPLKFPFDVCVLPYHGDLVIHELAALERYDLEDYLTVDSNHHAHYVASGTLRSVIRPNLGRDVDLVKTEEAQDGCN